MHFCSCKSVFYVLDELLLDELELDELLLDELELDELLLDELLDCCTPR